MKHKGAETRREKIQTGLKRSSRMTSKILTDISVFLSHKFSVSAYLCILILIFSLNIFPQNKFEDRTISGVNIAFEGTDQSASDANQFRTIAEDALGQTYSAVKVRDALAALYNTDKIVSAVVEANETGQNAVELRFVIKRKTRAEKVTIEVGNTVGDEVTEQELLLKLNLLNTGMAVTEQTLRNNANLILEYLRDRGYFNAEVTYKTGRSEAKRKSPLHFRSIRIRRQKSKNLI